mmetsp:Transcript_28756/g.48957  ORF Transcript_28756/g.48957 Transcript_28756/m.48957 type:complete len:213 (+) Transcript_28756:1336-1974(+)
MTQCLGCPRPLLPCVLLPLIQDLLQLQHLRVVETQFSGFLHDAVQRVEIEEPDIQPRVGKYTFPPKCLMAIHLFHPQSIASPVLLAFEGTSAPDDEVEAAKLFPDHDQWGGAFHDPGLQARFINPLPKALAQFLWEQAAIHYVLDAGLGQGLLQFTVQALLCCQKPVRTLEHVIHEDRFLQPPGLNSGHSAHRGVLRLHKEAAPLSQLLSAG